MTDKDQASYASSPLCRLSQMQERLTYKCERREHVNRRVHVKRHDDHVIWNFLRHEHVKRHASTCKRHNDHEHAKGYDCILHAWPAWSQANLMLRTFNKSTGEKNDNGYSFHFKKYPTRWRLDLNYKQSLERRIFVVFEKRIVTYKLHSSKLHCHALEVTLFTATWTHPRMAHLCMSFSQKIPIILGEFVKRGSHALNIKTKETVMLYTSSLREDSIYIKTKTGLSWRIWVCPCVYAIPALYLSPLHGFVFVTCVWHFCFLLVFACMNGWSLP